MLRLTPLGGHLDRRTAVRRGKDALMGAKSMSYTPKYRQDAAHLVLDTGRSIAAVSAEIGVGAQLLGRWGRDRAVTDG